MHTQRRRRRGYTRSDGRSRRSSSSSSSSDSDGSEDIDYDAPVLANSATERAHADVTATRRDVRYVFVLLRVLGGVRMLLLAGALAIVSVYKSTFDQRAGLYLAPQLCIAFFAMHAAIYLTPLYTGTLLATALSAAVANIILLTRLALAMRDTAVTPDNASVDNVAYEGLGWTAMFVGLLVPVDLALVAVAIRLLRRLRGGHVHGMRQPLARLDMLPRTVHAAAFDELPLPSAASYDAAPYDTPHWEHSSRAESMAYGAPRHAPTGANAEIDFSRMATT